MKQVVIHKAQRTLKDVEVPDTRIFIDQEIPDYKTLSDASFAYQSDARELCDALQNSLPGGTFDHLLVEMMSRKVSFFKVIHQ